MKRQNQQVSTIIEEGICGNGEERQRHVEEDAGQPKRRVQALQWQTESKE